AAEATITRQHAAIAHTNTVITRGEADIARLEEQAEHAEYMDAYAAAEAACGAAATVARRGGCDGCEARRGPAQGAGEARQGDRPRHGVAPRRHRVRPSSERGRAGLARGGTAAGRDADGRRV